MELYVEEISYNVPRIVFEGRKLTVKGLVAEKRKFVEGRGSFHVVWSKI